jgi:hypothetical protein
MTDLLLRGFDILEILGFQLVDAMLDLLGRQPVVLAIPIAMPAAGGRV